MKISGKIIDVVSKRIVSGTIHIKDNKIVKIDQNDHVPEQYILPGFIDAHVHIESSMVTPSEFGRVAVTHGTVATVSDPHEIANVLGIKGIEYMIESGRQIPFKFYFGAPSCVPATPFETSGAIIGADDIEAILKRDDIKYLAEMMNFPGVVHKNPEVMRKIQSALERNKRVDGHAPGLTGKDLDAYIEAGITSDHECYTLEEAREKAQKGMMIQIREGSAAKNFYELLPLLKEFPEKIMFCSDDKHPDELMKGHINQLVKAALVEGYNLMDVLSAASLNPVAHYGLEVGLLQIGDEADFIIVNNLEEVKISQVYIRGALVAENGRSLIEKRSADPVNIFNAEFITAETLKIPNDNSSIRLIEVIDGQLFTKASTFIPDPDKSEVTAPAGSDILKMVSYNRYQKAKPAVGFVKNFGLKEGAIASTVAHDSHNIIAVGVDDLSITNAINELINQTGGICCITSEESLVLPLPVGGIMSDMELEFVAEKYKKIDAMAKRLGSRLGAPFMTLSFLSLPVIPELKLTDKGLFDVNTFNFTSLKANDSIR